MSKFEEYRHSRLSWGIGVLGSLFVKIKASDGTEGYATGFGGPPACWLIEEHLKRFLIGKDPRDTNLIWDQVSVCVLSVSPRRSPAVYITTH
jgi:L-rhamnonate dehydratase